MTDNKNDNNDVIVHIVTTIVSNAFVDSIEEVLSNNSILYTSRLCCKFLRWIIRLNCHQGMFMPLISPTRKTPLVFGATLLPQLNGRRG